MGITSLCTGNPTLDLKITEWLEWDQNDKTRAEILSLINQNEVKKLENLMLNRLAFGTAGLRGEMGAGYAAMNDLVIIQTSQGLAAYLEKTVPDVKNRGVVISFDARHNSHRFAKLASQSFLQREIPVFLYSHITPTPFVPFAVLHLGCSAGIMVTASHNPKEDNGYKVYWNNGAQIIPPHDRGIQASIEKQLVPWPCAWDVDSISKNPLCQDPLSQMNQKYFAAMKAEVLNRKECEECPLRFTFTAMHGVSHTYMVEAFQTCGFQHFVSVKEQMEPDPDFPTVKFPNPEEGKSALDLSVKTANENGSPIILANDPDADRLAVAEKLPSGEWKVFTGNETGALLSWWLWHCFRSRNTEVPASDVYMISSTVSSKILQAIASKEGFNFIETLTGFKWMGNKAHELMEKGKTVLFAFEEAIGYMCGTAVLDKDGIASAMHIAQCAAYLKAKGISLYQQLDNIYKMYGYHVCNNSYFICHHQPTIKVMFERIRNFAGPGMYPKELGQYKVKGIRDLTTGYDSTQFGNKAVLPTSKSSQMITFYFENDCVATIRTSGTEPKIKYYTELRSKPNQGDGKSLSTELEQMVQLIIRDWLQPESNNLTVRSD